MTNQIQNPNVQKKYDLAERTALFGEAVIKFTPPLNALRSCRRVTEKVVLVLATGFNAPWSRAGFTKSLPDILVNRPLISQVVRSATSVGANYMEADGAESKKDFRHKIGICKKESKETMLYGARRKSDFDI